MILAERERPQCRATLFLGCDFGGGNDDDWVGEIFENLELTTGWD